MMTGPTLNLTTTTSTQIFLGSSTTPEGTVSALGGSNINLAGGAHNNGTNWIADGTVAAITSENAGATQFYGNTGLTVGNTFSPTLVAGVSTTGVINAVGGFTNNGNSAVEFNVSQSGPFGAFTSGAAGNRYQQCHVALNAGHFTYLYITTDLNGGSCTTAPTFNVYNNTANGTPVTANTNDNQTASAAQTLAVSPGGLACIVRTGDGSGCTAPWFFVTAQVKEP
jgi:hypothetical protein